MSQVFERASFAGVEAMRASDRLYRKIAPLGVHDIAMAVQYSHCERPPLSGVPIVSFDGLADNTIDRGNIDQWRHYTTGSHVNIPVKGGTHYFVSTHFRQVRHAVQEYSLDNFLLQNCAEHQPGATELILPVGMD